jgi:hypothetical protein
MLVSAEFKELHRCLFILTSEASLKDVGGGLSGFDFGNPIQGLAPAARVANEEPL